MWKELGKFGMGPPSGGGGQQPGRGGQRSPLGRNPVLWIVVIGAILIYTQMDGSGSLFRSGRPGPCLPHGAWHRIQITGDSSWSITPARRAPTRTSTRRALADLFRLHLVPRCLPSAMLVMVQVIEDLKLQDRAVQPIFITVDPQRDTVEKLANYVAQLPGLIGLTGSEEQVASALQSFGITWRSQAAGPTDTNYLVDHTALFYLMGPEGEFLQHYVPTQGPTQIALEIEREFTG